MESTLHLGMNRVQEGNDGIGFVLQETHSENSVENGMEEGKVGRMKSIVRAQRRKNENLN